MILDGGSPCEHTQFPIYDTRTNNKGNLRQVTIQPQIRRADIWAALEAAQPYQNVAPTKTELSIISTLNNHDKHRLLLTVAGVLNVDENPLSYSLAEGVAPRNPRQYRRAHQWRSRCMVRLPRDARTA